MYRISFAGRFFPAGIHLVFFHPIRHAPTSRTIATPGPNPFMDQYKSLRHDKWIVVTAVQAHTEQVRTLSTLQGWQLVVIGDRKTPEPWSLPGTIYIGVKDQAKLGYRITDFLPLNRYTRKSLGYIFAIQHGAEVIYETDDDNVPTVDLINFFLSENEVTGMVINATQITYNPCRHFGQSTLWPRGFPLDRIGESDPHDYQLCSMKTPPIQQGFVNGDPDLDALYRLTRKHNSRPLDIRFDSAAPPVVLPPGTFSPMNSQNTLYTKKALWALILPTTVTDRVTDIYRAYWSERLLWLIGEMVAFFPPNAYQTRSPHSYISDATMEMEMYQMTPKLLQFLTSWNCGHDTLPDCAIAMSDEMAKKDFWRPKDVELVSAWFDDLRSVGYSFPPLFLGSTFTSACSDVVYYPDEKNTSWMHHPRYILPDGLTNVIAMESHITDICNFPKRVNYQSVITNSAPFQDVVLVVSVHDIKNVLILNALHKPHFPNIIYCGIDLDYEFFHRWNLTYAPIHVSRSGYKCLTEVMKMRHLVAGYMYIPESVMVLGKSFSPSDFKDDPWVPRGFEVTKQQSNKNTTMQGKITSCVSERLKSKAELKDEPIYLPRKYRDIFATLFSAFTQKDRHILDNVLPLLVQCADSNTRLLSSATVGTVVEEKSHYIQPFLYQISNGNSDHKQFVCTYFQKL